MKSLIAEGVDVVFGYPGGQIISVYDKLYDYTDQVKHILVRHEQGAIHAAEGYARVSNRPGVVIVTSGPGAANVVTGLSDAMMDSTPVVVISGQVNSKFLGNDAFQETDVVGITLPVTKWSLQVRDAKDVPAAIAKAFYVATSGRPGPVVIDIAKDAQVGLLEWSHKKVNYIRSYDPKPIVSPSEIVRAANMLNEAKHPMILAGHGVMISGAEQELIQLAEKANMPVATTLLGLSAVPSDHPLNVGMLGMHGNIGPNYLTNEADVILAVGMRFDDRVTGDVSRYANQADIIHIDIDKSEFNRNVKVKLPIHGDAREVLRQLVPMIEPAKHDAWLSRFAACRQVEVATVEDAELHHGGMLTMGQVVDALAHATKGDAIMVTDVGQNQMLGAKYSRFVYPRSIVTSGGLGTMGFAIPAAIGAKIGSPDRQVCMVCGDGGFQMTIEELGTIMQYQTPVKMVILNNDFLGNVRQWQELFFHGRFSQTPMLNPDFKMIAAAYGIEAENVETLEELDGALKRMLESERPYLLNVRVDERDMVFPMITPGSSVSEILINANQKFEYPQE